MIGLVILIMSLFRSRMIINPETVMIHAPKCNHGAFRSAHSYHVSFALERNQMEIITQMTFQNVCVSHTKKHFENTLISNVAFCLSAHHKQYCTIQTGDYCQPRSRTRVEQINLINKIIPSSQKSDTNICGHK